MVQKNMLDRLSEKFFNKPTHISLTQTHPIQYRPIRATDGSSLVEIFTNMSPASRYFRYHQPVISPSPKWLREWVASVAQLPAEQSFGLLALASISPITTIPVGMAYCVKTKEGSAEFAVMVRDDFQRKGIGTTLVTRLAEKAAAQGIHTLKADVLCKNLAMLRVVEKLLYKTSRQVVYDCYVVSVDLKSPITRYHSIVDLNPCDERPLFQYPRSNDL